MTVARDEAMRAALVGLDEELRRTLAAGVRPPCTRGGDAWLSEDADERAEAAEACGRCPAVLRAACREAGRFQSFGVFGGVDVTRRSAGGVR